MPIVEVNKRIHRNLALIKFHSNIKIKTLTSELLAAALNSPLLEKVLMKKLGDPQKVRHVLKKLEQNSYL